MLHSSSYEDCQTLVIQREKEKERKEKMKRKRVASCIFRSLWEMDRTKRGGMAYVASISSCVSIAVFQETLIYWYARETLSALKGAVSVDAQYK